MYSISFSTKIFYLNYGRLWMKYSRRWMNRWMTDVQGIHPFIQPSQILEILAGTNTMQPTDCNQIMLDYLFLDWYFGEDWTKSKPFKGLNKTCQEYFSRTFSSFVQWVPYFFVQFCSSRKIPNCLWCSAHCLQAFLSKRYRS